MPSLGSFAPVTGWCRTLLNDLRVVAEDMRQVLRWEAARFRDDHDHRDAVIGSLLRGLLGSLGRGRRATLLWLLTVVLELGLALLQAMRHITGDADEWSAA